MMCPIAHALNFRPSPAALQDSFDHTFEMPQENISSDTIPDVEEDELLFTDNKKKFLMKSLKVSGTTLLKKEEIESLSTPYLNKRISTADLGRIAEKLTDIYQERGYIFSRVYVPFQNTSTGQIVLKALEGTVHKISYRWINMPSNPDLKKILEELKTIKPFTTEALEIALRYARRIPGLSISFTARPDLHNQGELMIVIAQQTTTYQAGLSDSMPNSLGRWVAQSAVDFNSLLGMGEKLKLHGAFYPTHRFNTLMFYGGDFSFPLSENGTNLLLKLDLMRSQPNLKADGITQARGKLKTYGVGVSQELINRSTFYLDVSALIDRKKLSETTLYATGRYTKNMEKNLSVRFSSKMKYQNKNHGSSNVTVTYHQGVNDKWSRKEDPSATGRLNYKKITGLLTHTYPLESFTLYGLVRGQYAFTAPLQMERFFYGGAPFATANPIGVLNGESGIHSKFEVRYGIDLSAFINKLVTYTYYEYARIWNGRSSKNLLGNGANISATGLGLKGEFGNGLQAFFEYGIPLRSKINQMRLKKQIYAGISFNNQYGS